MHEKILTKDGSVTYRHQELGVTYRSVNGAASESRHVFLEGTKLEGRPDPWRVLELGFGTGLNFQLTHERASGLGKTLEYWSLEPAPMPRDLWLTGEPWTELTFDREFCQGNSTLRLLSTTWQESHVALSYFDAVYHDPFGPGACPDCWTTGCFEWSLRALKEDGILATFGASTKARQAMKDAGFFVGSKAGAAGKREMTVASKSESAIGDAKAWKRS